MKLTLFLLIICMLCSSFLSCSNTTPLDESAATTTAATTDSDESTPPSSPFFFFGAGAEGSLAQANGNPKQYGVETDKKTVTEDNLIGTTITPFADGVKYTYIESTRALKNTVDGEYGSFYSHYITYLNADNYRVDVLAGTEQIGYFFQPIASDYTGLTTLSEKELRTIAEKFILQCISEKAFEKMEFRNSQQSEKYCLFHYDRYIEGYATDESIMIMISNYGQIIGYNGYSVCKFDSLLPQITKDKLDDAHARLLAQLGAFECKVTPVGSPILTTGTSGELYLYVSYSYVDANGNETIQRLYTNVN